MNQTIREEKKVEAFGHTMRAFPVIATEAGRIINQNIKDVAYYKEGGTEYRIVVELSFDDNCRNGHESFHVTAEIVEKTRSGWREHSGGCCHEEIAKRFPRLAHLIKWHFMDINGPMYYIENTTYHATNKDNGKLKGEPTQWKDAVYFGNSPIANIIGPKLCQFLKERQGTGDFLPLVVPHINREGDTYKFDDKYTFVGFEREWHQCPFDNLQEAQEFALAMRDCKARFVSIETAWAKGKARDFKGARSCAMWPEATDEQLSLPKAELSELLRARLPQLIVDFKADMLACGFVYPTLEAATRGE